MLYKFRSKFLVLVFCLFLINESSSFAGFAAVSEVGPNLTANIIGYITDIFQLVQTIFFGIESLQGLWESVQKVACTEEEANRQKALAIELKKFNIAFKRACTAIDANASLLDRVGSAVATVGNSVSNFSKVVGSLDKMAGNASNALANGLPNVDFRSQLDSVADILYSSTENKLFEQDIADGIIAVSEESSRIAEAISNAEHESDWATINVRAVMNNNRVLSDTLLGVKSLNRKITNSVEAYNHYLSSSGVSDWFSEKNRNKYGDPGFYNYHLKELVNNSFFKFKNSSDFNLGGNSESGDESEDEGESESESE